MKRVNEVLIFLTSLAAPQAAGGIGSFFTRAGLDPWYATLAKPSFTPPSWLFAPVWVTLYLLMGISAFLVWRRGWNAGGVKPALTVFGAQLILNSLWSYAFFGRQSPGAGVAVIAVLGVLIIVTMLRFLRISRTAGLLLLPYLLWVGFAAVLNYSIFALNR